METSITMQFVMMRASAEAKAAQVGQPGVECIFLGILKLSEVKAEDFAKAPEAMPKTVLSGTAMITVSSDIFRAWIASGSVICLITSPIPSSKVLTRATPIGSSSRAVR